MECINKVFKDITFDKLKKKMKMYEFRLLNEKK